MSCVIFLFRKEYISYDSATRTDLIKQQLFWRVTSSELGCLFSEYYQISDEWKYIDSDEFLDFCNDLIAEGKDVFDEYQKGALKVVVENLQELSDDVRHESDWFITMDF